MPKNLNSLLLVIACLVFASTASGKSKGKTSQDSPSSVIQKLFAQDQRDQEDETMSVDDFESRQHTRRDVAIKIVLAGSLKSAQDYERAAWLLMHGRGTDDFLLAHVLGLAAAVDGLREARFLCAASLDRYLESLKQRQLFGSQTNDAFGSDRPVNDPKGLVRSLVSVFAKNGVAWRVPQAEYTTPKATKAASKEIHKLAKAAIKDAKPTATKRSSAKNDARTKRLAQTMEHVTKGSVVGVVPYFDAAHVLTHGEPGVHIQLGHVLAVASLIEGHAKAPHLCAHTLDRLQRSLGRPQVFGTLNDAAQAATKKPQRPSFGKLHKSIRKKFTLKPER